VGAIAKGVRRQESKLGPSLELYGHVDVLLAKGRGELDVVAQVQRMPGLRIAGDVEAMSHAALIAELAERVCEDRHPVDGVYELTVMALDELARETDPRRASAYFMMAALDLLGCAAARPSALLREPLVAKPAAFSAEAGGFLCDSCAAGDAFGAAGRDQVLRLMASGDIATTGG
jgi:DNA repair protein RecO (recombination protein O)